MKDKTKAISTRLTDIERGRIVLLADEKKWTVSHMIHHILNEYCEKYFKPNSTEYKEG